MEIFRKRNSIVQQQLHEAVKRQYRCAFTGHRPEKVIGSEGRIIVELRKEILQAIDEGYNVFLTGMSRGVVGCGYRNRASQVQQGSETHVCDSL